VVEGVRGKVGKWIKVFSGGYTFCLEDGGCPSAVKSGLEWIFSSNSRVKFHEVRKRALMRGNAAKTSILTMAKSSAGKCEEFAGN
jgi:hypothetical protein